MDGETPSTDQQADQLWQSRGAESFAVVQLSISEAHDRVDLDDARYWLDVETRLYTLSQAPRAT